MPYSEPDEKDETLSFQELKKLVAEGEGHYLEFKRKAKFPHKILKEISAFANSEGGRLLLGVADDGSIPGLSQAEEEAFIMEEYMKKFLRPEPQISVSKVSVPGMRSWVLVYVIEPHAPGPVFVLPELQGEERRAYIRKADESLQASKEMRDIIRYRHSGRSFRFEYGIKERMLLEYLEKNKAISLTQMCALAGVDRETASRTLVLLCLCGVLDIRPDEKGDSFVLKNNG